MAKEAAKLGLIDFGSDAWGKWAAGVQERLDALEKNAHVPVDFDPMLKRLDALEKFTAAQVDNVIRPPVVTGDVNERLTALERAAGIHPAIETDKAASDV